MDGSKLTEEEHIARAMLMGMWYGNKAHMYYLRGKNGGTTKRLDADTLEPINKKQSAERMLKIGWHK